jgi:hypothetical protein
MRGNKLHVDQTKRDRQRPAALAKGGQDKMFKEQAAGPAKSGITGKAQTAAPGAKAAKGGGQIGQLHTGGRSVPAKPGATGPR